MIRHLNPCGTCSKPGSSQHWQMVATSNAGQKQSTCSTYKVFFPPAYERVSCLSCMWVISHTPTDGVSSEKSENQQPKSGQTNSTVSPGCLGSINIPSHCETDVLSPAGVAAEDSRPDRVTTLGGSATIPAKYLVSWDTLCLCQNSYWKWPFNHLVRWFIH